MILSLSAVGNGGSMFHSMVHDIDMLVFLGTRQSQD